MDGSPHDHKFDRQLRLWGAHGQQALESANVLVLGSGPIASEYVKALVLANVQAFVIMDHALVCMDDLGNNFFLTNDDVGRPRATAVAALLNELNPECSVSSVIRDPSIFIESCRRAPDNEDIQFLRKFNLVLASEIPLQFASHLCDRLYSENIPLLHARSFGLIGALRLALSEHVVVETHPDSDMPDLYLHQSQLARFPALDQFLSTFNVLDPNPDEFQFSHIPFPAILVQLSRKYRSLNPDASVNPSSFKDFISSHDRFKSTNFKEALRYSHYVLRDPKSFISPSLQRILSDPRACSTSKSTHFWILVRALKEFLQNEGQGFFPVSSRLPDMTAETSSYVSIKSIYAEQSLRDRDALSAHARNILRSLELPETYISDFFIDLFAKNCRTIDVSQMASLSRDNGTDCDESVKSVICEALAEEIDGLDAINAGSSDAQIEQPPNDIHWYIALKCADAFYSQNHRYPGDCDDALLEDDIAKLKAIALEIFQSVELGTEHVNVMCLQEIVRFGSSTIHNTAAVVAGIASQESLKLLTNQYVPFNDMCLWNGVHATLARWKM